MAPPQPPEPHPIRHPARLPRLGRAAPTALLLILVLAAGLRLWGLGGQPVIFFDSGQHLGEARFLVSRGAEGHAPDQGKPGQAILLAGSMLLLGQTTLAGTLPSALAGIGTVLLTYAIGSTGWNRRVGLLAALLLAISGQHLVYSREAWVEATGLFFAALASLVYLRGGPPLLIGALFGLAFSCNTRIWYLPLALAPAELARGPINPRRLGTLAVGFGLPLAAIEAGFLIVGQKPDYALQLLRYWREHPTVLRFDEWPTFFVDLALLDGLALPILGGAGVALAARQRTRADLLLLGSLLVPVALYSVYTATGEVRMRDFSLSLPWTMLAAALALDRLLRRPLLTGLAAAGLLALAVPRSLDLLAAPNGAPAAVDFLHSAGETRAASTNGAVFGFYVGEDHTNAKYRPAYINSPDDLAALARDYRYIVVDMQAYLYPGTVTDRYDLASPALAVPHGSASWYLADLLETRGVAWGEWDSLLADWQRHRANATQLRVLELPSLT